MDAPDTVYQAPEANLESIRDANTFYPTFSNLSIGRKIALVLMWLFYALVVGMLGFGVWVDDGVEPEVTEGVETLFGLAVMLAGLYIWTHMATVKRKVGQLAAISIINLFVTGNLVSCLIALSIRSSSKLEREEYTFPDE
ncbi:Uncharacterised protein [BD1-7 clade bacterium]|uniref:Uncharacterized protein n=1 Tax=BD1-7 clade bacterium TaxID=2029982 RepID=A0A5S9PZK5_9GAMM|nr:Uncharacterised protein [BD1-7 clade bacterium]CAA0110176.1 Uncharacterised protein [BD1-7 clade bacterium]